MTKTTLVTQDSPVGRMKAQQRQPESRRFRVTQVLGNGAIQRLLVQRNWAGPTELDDVLAGQINSARGNGVALDGAVQKKMGESLGADFGGVRVHTDKRAHELNQQLNARAFTTGQDVFFRQGEYDPASSAGQELLAHELTHVVQQSSGAVQGSGRMTVNAPGDRFEQEANAAARSLSSAPAPAVQRAPTPSEEEEAVQAQTIQRADMPDEEEAVQTRLQRQEMAEEDEVGTT